MEKNRESKIVKSGISKIKIVVFWIVAIFIALIFYATFYDIDFLVKNKGFYRFFLKFTQN